MKKTFIAASMLGIFAAGSVSAADETVNVTFTGEVKDLTCTVQVGGPNNIVNLGTIKAEDGAIGTIVPVMFRFAGCKPDAKLKTIKLTGAQNGSPKGEDIAQGILGTEQSTVKVKLMTNVDGTFKADPVAFGDPQTGMVLTDGDAVTPYYAQLQAKGTPKPGTVHSNAVFTVVYN